MKFLLNSAFVIVIFYFSIAAYGNFRQLDRPFSAVEVDEATGCEYMVNRNGGITPRIAADYMHMGCKGVQDNE